MSMNGITGQRPQLQFQRSEGVSRRSSRSANRPDDAEIAAQLARTGEPSAPAAQTSQTAQTGAAAENAGVAASGAVENGADAAKKVDSYEPASSGRPAYQVDMKTVMQMKAETEARMAEIVQKTLSRQITGGKSSNLFDLLRSGQFTREDAIQAQRDVSENGVWGVEQTSDRIVKMAQALTGGDPSKQEGMIKAFEKGYKAAEKAMGGSLPGISQRTRQAVLDKFDALRQQNQRAQEAQVRTEADRGAGNQREQTRTGAVAAAVGVS